MSKYIKEFKQLEEENGAIESKKNSFTFVHNGATIIPCYTVKNRNKDDISFSVTFNENRDYWSLNDLRKLKSWLDIVFAEEPLTPEDISFREDESDTFFIGNYTYDTPSPFHAFGYKDEWYQRIIKGEITCIHHSYSGIRRGILVKIENDRTRGFLIAKVVSLETESCFQFEVLSKSYIKKHINDKGL